MRLKEEVVKVKVSLTMVLSLKNCRRQIQQEKPNKKRMKHNVYTFVHTAEIREFGQGDEGSRGGNVGKDVCKRRVGYLCVYIRT